MKEEKLLENATAMGAYAKELLLELKANYPVVKDIRGVGLMLGIELCNPETGEADGKAVKEVLDLCLEKGVLFYLCGNSGEVIRMIPPLTITKEQIDDGIAVLDEALQEFVNK
jgi:4-aminobutyrate aminotransferase